MDNKIDSVQERRKQNNKRGENDYFPTGTGSILPERVFTKNKASHVVQEGRSVLRQSAEARGVPLDSTPTHGVRSG